MTKIYTQKYGSAKGTIGELIEAEIHNAPDYHAGELESLRARQEKMENIIRLLIDKLGAKVQARIVEARGYIETDEEKDDDE